MDHVDEKIDAAPFDSTPFVYDTQVFLEVLLKGEGFPGSQNNTGEVKSPLPLSKGNDAGELRLQSDFAIARDSRTACYWQGFVSECHSPPFDGSIIYLAADKQDHMAASFKAAMAKLAVLGQKRSKLIDCSDVVPATVKTKVKSAR